MEKLLSLLRWTRISVLSLAMMGVMEMVIAITPRDKRFGRYFHFMNLWGRLFLRGNGYHLEEADRIPRDEAVIFASNHQSHFDIPLFHALLPVPFSWLSRHDLFEVPFIGRALRRIEAVEVVRSDRRKAAESIGRAVSIVKSGRSVVVFPEGTWGYADGRMRGFKRGVIKIARQSGASVVPITIIGGNKVNPPPTKIIRRGEMRMVVGNPMGPDTWEGVSDEQWLEELRKAIAAPLEGGA